MWHASRHLSWLTLGGPVAEPDPTLAECVSTQQRIGWPHAELATLQQEHTGMEAAGRALALRSIRVYMISMVWMVMNGGLVVRWVARWLVAGLIHAGMAR
jgi:hypothetical protein